MHTGLTETIAVVGVVIIGILSVFYADTNTVSIVTGGILGWLGRGALHAGNNTTAAK